MTKTRLLHEALLLAGVIETLFNFILRLAIILPVLIWFKLPLSLTILIGFWFFLTPVIYPSTGFIIVTGLSLLCFAAGWLCYRLARPHLTARL